VLRAEADVIRLVPHVEAFLCERTCERSIGFPGASEK
jgi:hypothetical protein